MHGKKIRQNGWRRLAFTNCNYCPSYRYQKMKKFFYKSFFLSMASFVFYNCNSGTEPEKPTNTDSIINALNAADTVTKIQQGTVDSVNKLYLDSFRKHAADSNNAEYGSPH